MNDSDLLEEISYSEESDKQEENNNNRNDVLKRESSGQQGLNDMSGEFYASKTGPLSVQIESSGLALVDSNNYIKLMLTLNLDEIDSGDSVYTDDEDAVLSESE